MSIYKILTAPQWREMQAQGRFDGSADDLRDGFIHLSSAEQLDGTLARHFAGVADVVVLAVDPTALGSALIYEPARNGALFPHLYAPLPLAVCRVV